MTAATFIQYTQSGNVKRYESSQGPFLWHNNILYDSANDIFSLSSTYTSDSCDYSISPIGGHTEEYLLDVAGTYYVDVIYGNTTKRFNYKYNYNKVISVNYYVAFGKSSFHYIYAAGGQSVDTVKLYKTSGYNAGNHITISSSDYIGNDAIFRYEALNNITKVCLSGNKYEFASLGLSELNKYFQVYVNISTDYLSLGIGIFNDRKITRVGTYETFSVSDFDIDPGSDIYINIIYVPKYVYLDTAWDIQDDKVHKDWSNMTADVYGSRIRTISTDDGGWNRCTNFLSQIVNSPYALVDAHQYKDDGTNFYAAPVIPRFNGFRSSLLVRKGGDDMTNTSDLATIGYDNLSNYTPRYEVVTSRGDAHPKNANITNGEFMYANTNDSYIRPFSSDDLDTYFFRAAAKDGDTKYFDNDLGHYRNGVTNSTLINGKAIAIDYILHYTQTQWMGKHYNTNHYTGLTGLYSTNDNTDGTYNEIDKVLQGTMYWDAHKSDKMAAGILTPYFYATCQSMDYKQEIPQYGILTGIKGWGSNHYNNWCATFSVPTYGGILAKPYDNSTQPYAITYGTGGTDKGLPFRTTNNTGVKPGSMIVGRVHSGGASGYTGVFWSRFYVDVISNIEFVKKNWVFDKIYS